MTPLDMLRMSAGFTRISRRCFVSSEEVDIINTRKKSAVELLLSYPDTGVAEILGVRLVTLRRWMSDPSFISALRIREQQQKAGAARLARQTVLNAAAALCRVTSDGETSPDPKVLIEILKQSGAFNAEIEDTGDSLIDRIRAVMSEDDGGGGLVDE